ncbi:2-deoxy-D-gluconate 3-dehydrogenase [Penicillium sp. IBT 35674x]|nr:2-deoxy-D-gluconate 3-dehydrogenase [Penicillium sp. IBT 35674x]KAJ5982335.1 2-deoxy-D-gluconate 3-dehydrogenase [Penicillium sp. IBT 35674x]
MSIGGSHKWNSDPGVWQETKAGLNLWRIDFKPASGQHVTCPRAAVHLLGTKQEQFRPGMRGTANKHVIARLPPVIASEKVKSDQVEKGQQSSYALFCLADRNKEGTAGDPRKIREHGIPFVENGRAL